MSELTPPSDQSTANLDTPSSMTTPHQGTLNSDIWRSVVEEDYQKILSTIHWEALFPQGSIPIQLLDIGCGIGTFPHILRPYLNKNMNIFYDYLDPAHYCLSMCQQVLHPPYQARRAFHNSIEDASLSIYSTRYDIIWALQSLNAIQPQDVPKSIQTINDVLNPHRGTALIMLPKQDAFIPQLYERYTRLFSQQHSRNYLTAEPILTALSNQGMPAIVREVECTHTISIRDEYRLDQYLQQCIMDSAPSEGWRHKPQMRDFLDSFRHVDVYRFPNPVWVIVAAPSQSGLAGRRRLLSYLQPISSDLVA